jgi:hypothetical protein
MPSSGNRCLLVAVRSHFGLRLGGRINPERASNRILGRRIIYSYCIWTPVHHEPRRGAKLIIIHYRTGQKRVKSNLSQQKVDRITRGEGEETTGLN